MIKIEHQLFEVSFPHLAVTDANVGLRDQRANLRRATFDRFDRVVQEVDLATTANLPQHGFADRGGIPFEYEGLHGQSLGGRCRDQR